MHSLYHLLQRKDPLPLQQLQTDCSPWISPHDVITICGLESLVLGYEAVNTGSATTKNRKQSRRPRMVVVDIRTADEYEPCLCTITACMSCLTLESTVSAVHFRPSIRPSVCTSIHLESSWPPVHYPPVSHLNPPPGTSKAMSLMLSTSQMVTCGQTKVTPSPVQAQRHSHRPGGGVSSLSWTTHLKPVLMYVGWSSLCCCVAMYSVGLSMP